MTVAVIWILMQMNAPWWVVAIFVLASACKGAVGFLNFFAEYEGKP